MPQETAYVRNGIEQTIPDVSEVHANSLFSDMLWLLSGVPLGHMLYAVAQLGVADELAGGPLTVEELAKRTDTNADALYRVLRGVATKGVFTEVAHRTFGLTQLAQLLRSDGATSLRDAFRMHSQKCMRDTFSHIGHALRTGESSFEHVNGAPLFRYFAERPAENELFSSFTGSAARRMQCAAMATYDLVDVRRVVDVGEMGGDLLAFILDRYPVMTGVYFDQPFMIDGAERVLNEAGVGDRVELVGGNLREAAPPGGDVYLVPQVLHRTGDTESIEILRSIRKVMAPTSRVLVIDPVLPEGDSSHLATVLDSTMLMLGPIRDRTEAEFAEIFGKAGLTLVEIRGRALPASLLIAVPDTATASS